MTEPEDGEPSRLLCLVVSHSYLEPEVAKSLEALSSYMDVHLITPRRSAVLVFDEKRSDELQTDTYGVTGLRRFPRGGPLFVLGSLRLGLDRRPDVVLVEYDPWTPLFWQVLIARRVFSPRTRLHLAVKKNTFRQRPRAWALLKRGLARAGLRRVSGVFAASRMAADLYRREFALAADSVRVLPIHPVDTETFFPRTDPHDPAVVRIGFVGALSTRKGVDVLLSAVQRLRRQGLSVELHVMGPVEQDVAAVVAGSTIDGTMRVHAPVPNREVAEFLRTLDIFVLAAARLPDHEEHDGRALLEAMASGLPCVGSDSGVIPEVLADGRGRIFPAGDVTALAVELRDLAVSADERRRLGQRARTFVERSASSKVVAHARFAALSGAAIQPEGRLIS